MALTYVSLLGPHTDNVVSCSGVLRAIAQAGGAALWANSGKSYEEAVQLCLAHLEDASRATGDAFAGALGDLVSASKSAAAVQAVRPSQSCLRFPPVFLPLLAAYAPLIWR